MAIKKGSKNSIENRGAVYVDKRGEPVVIIKKGKRTVLFEKGGAYYDKKGEAVTL